MLLIKCDHGLKVGLRKDIYKQAMRAYFLPSINYHQGNLGKLSLLEQHSLKYGRIIKK